MRARWTMRIALPLPRRPPPLDIMHARRVALAHLIAGLAEVRRGRLDDAQRRMAALRALDAGGDPIQVSWQHALTGEIALAERRFDEAESAFRASDTTSLRASRFIRRSSRSSTICRSATAWRARRLRAAIFGARSISTGSSISRT